MAFYGMAVDEKDNSGPDFGHSEQSPKRCVMELSLGVVKPGAVWGHIRATEGVVQRGAKKARYDY